MPSRDRGQDRHTEPARPRALDSVGVDAQEPRQSLLRRHGITRSVVVRLGVMVALVMVVGIRFERTYVAIAICAVFLAVVFALGHGPDDEPR